MGNRLEHLLSAAPLNADSGAIDQGRNNINFRMADAARTLAHDVEILQA